MAVIAELIEAGIQMKRGGNLRGAIEHFRQLQATFPGNPRIAFELANAWTAFAVPQQALPLYQELLALPPGQGLPPKDMPRLYTRLGATLLELGDTQEALTTVEAGLSLHPSYRPLRIMRIMAMSQSGADRLALLDALELLLESLAPSRWDIFEADIQAAVKRMRADCAGEAANASQAPKAAPQPPASQKPAEAARVQVKLSAEPHEDDEEAASPAEPSIAVTVKPAKPPKSRARAPRRKPASRPAQLGKKAVRIDISGQGDAADEDNDGDEDKPASPGAFKIPIEPD